MEQILPLGVKTLLNPVNGITSGSSLYESSNMIGCLGDFSRNYIGSLKDHIGIIMGSKCHHISILKGTLIKIWTELQQDEITSIIGLSVKNQSPR